MPNDTVCFRPGKINAQGAFSLICNPRCEVAVILVDSKRKRKKKKKKLDREAEEQEEQVPIMQDPPNPNKNINPKTNPTPETQNFPYGQAQPFYFRSSCHRRAHSEVHFRLPEDLDLVSDPFEGPSGSTFDELGSEDDIFCTYMDIEKLGSRPDEGPSGLKPDNAVNGSSGGGGGDEVDGEKNVRPRHRYSNSVDGSSIMESIEAKKAMAPDKLAELWTVDPKRAKRFCLYFFILHFLKVILLWLASKLSN